MRRTWGGVALYLLLTLWASMGVALQLYFMQVQNPLLRTEMCRTGEVEVEHAPLCGLQVAPPLPVVEPPARPTPWPQVRVRLEAQPGQAGVWSSTPFSRAPPLGLSL